MELLKKNAPINNLLAEKDRVEILKIYDRAKTETLTIEDVSDLFRLTQQNCAAFTQFQMSLILRIAEVLSRGDNLRESCEYIHGNISGAYGFYD